MKKKKLSLEKILKNLNIYTQVRMYEKDGYFYAYLYDDDKKKLLKKVSTNKSDIIKFVLPAINKSWQLKYKNV